MQLAFLTPPIDRLRADGVFERVHDGGFAGRLRAPVLLLSRDLCAFSLFDTANLPRSRRRPAARLYARTASPYIAGGVALVTCADDFGIWWWDLERIGPMVEAHYGKASPAIRPETLAQPVGSGWRIVALGDGYEAQLWRARCLVASVWRKDRFDAAGWVAFTRLQRTSEPAPDLPPAQQSLPIAPDSEAFSLARIQISREQATGTALAGFAVVIASSIAFLLGQGVQLSQDSQAIEKETAEILQATPQAGATRALEVDRQKLAAYRQLEERTNPVSAAGAAIGIVAYHDLTPTSLEAAEGQLTLTLPYSAVDRADELVAEFEGSGYFYDVSPRTDSANQSLIFEMKTREAAPPLSAGG